MEKEFEFVLKGKEMAAKTKVKKGSWTRDEEKHLRKNFTNNLTIEVASELGRGTDAVKKKAARMGLKKTKKYLKTLGRI